MAQPKEDAQPIHAETADDSTVWTASTPPATVHEPTETVDGSSPSNGHDLVVSSAVPWQDSTYIIRDIFTGGALTLLDGQVTLAPLGGNNRGSVHWRCVESQGWLGFQNTVSGKFLGHSLWGWLVCEAWQQHKFENFCVRAAPRGGYILFLTHWEQLWRMGFGTNNRGERRLAKVEHGEVDGMVWEFIGVM